jgi:hypothetical protein
MSELLTTAEAASWLKCSVAALKKWRFQERGPAFLRIGRMIRYHRHDLECFVQRHAVKRSTSPSEAVLDHSRGDYHRG